YADVLNQLGRFEEAEPVLGALVASGRRGLPAGHWFLGDFLMRHGIALRGLGAFADAEAKMLEAYEILAAAGNARSGRKQQCIEELIRLYEVQEQEDQAMRWRQRLNADAQADESPDSG
ncbi:MAG: hypothetical protein AB7N71_09085, partial [Phycisphaerae bacterium]